MGTNTYHVYMMTNRWHNVLYTGVTNNLADRVWQHKNKAVPGFTSKYNCDCLVYFEDFDEITQAIAREKQIKGWIRRKKNELIERTNPDWTDLSADWFSGGREGILRFAQDDTGLKS